jgi:hypothetical protein
MGEMTWKSLSWDWNTIKSFASASLIEAYKYNQLSPLFRRRMFGVVVVHIERRGGLAKARYEKMARGSDGLEERARQLLLCLITL